MSGITSGFTPAAFTTTTTTTIMPMQAALPPPPPPPSAPQADNGLGVGLTVTSGVSPTLTSISDQPAPRSRRQSEDKRTSGSQTPQSVESDWNENKPDDTQTSCPIGCTASILNSLKGPL